MENPVNTSSNEYFKCLSWGPSKRVKSCRGYFVNGCRFHTQERDSGSLTYNCGVRVKDVDVQNIRILIQLLGELKSVDIRGRSSFFDEDEEQMVRGSKKKRAHPETSTPTAAASISLETSTPPAMTSIPPGTSPSPATAYIPTRTSTPLATASPVLHLWRH
ncbi:hypothetical protein M9H77_16319 [Catharanthus roseus]|uniref:Uncharacterized protein n=1 Tax=Catharanthus roseus TaxID=4058 RepID=A0ACC0B1F3_CATRO|nr:hypothetical protein M9H77_16319 [Catharanthus roseus]